jgi:hypothetical protein
VAVIMITWRNNLLYTKNEGDCCGRGNNRPVDMDEMKQERKRSDE